MIEETARHEKECKMISTKIESEKEQIAKILQNETKSEGNERIRHLKMAKNKNGPNKSLCNVPRGSTSDANNSINKEKTFNTSNDIQQMEPNRCTITEVIEGEVDEKQQDQPTRKQETSCTKGRLQNKLVAIHDQY